VLEGVGLLVVLLLRGVALWMVAPFVAVVWLLSYPVAALLRRRVALRQALGWADLNLIAAVERALPSLLIGEREGFVGWRNIREVTHRIDPFDLA
jgi:hypothetical protein